MTAPVLRELAGLAEFRAAEDLQRAVWGPDERVDPYDLMLVIQHEGGLVAGAFDAEGLVAYVFGFPTREPDVQHSHRLAVHPRGRGGGLGVRLKWFQRSWCLDRGIRLVRWTYDPLRHVNASLNITRLGAEVATYFVDYYGDLPGINAGAPTDRLLADWHLEAPGVVARARGEAPGPVAAAARVAIPADFEAMLGADPAAANAERLRVRVEMRDLLARGLVIRGYDPARREYLFTPA
jgi:predicted GNAT superfamily acetyltransferase